MKLFRQTMLKGSFDKNMKKLFFLLFAGAFIGLLFFPLRTCASQPEFLISSTDGSDCYSLLDGDYGTTEPFHEGTTLSITAEEPITGLFIIWEYLPGSWTLMDGSNPVQCGQDGILHEFIPLSGTTDTVSFTIEPETVTIADIYVLSGGEIPSFVQVWKKAWEEPVDVLFFTDGESDEGLFLSNLVPENAKVQAACYTDFDSGESYRNHVLLSRLWNMGIDHFPLLSAESLNPEDAAAAVQDTVRRFRPQVVVVPQETEHASLIRSAAESAGEPEKVVAVSSEHPLTAEEVMEGVPTYAMQELKSARAQMREQAVPKVPAHDVETNLKAGNSLKILIYIIAAFVILLTAADLVILKTRRVK